MYQSPLGLVLDLCHCHGLTPNLRPGKTEVILAFRGKHSRSLKRKYYSEANARHITAIAEHRQYHVGVVGEYKHLGGIIHATGETKREARRRVAMAFSTFNQHRKILFHDDKIPLQKRTQLFATLVLSQFVYGMESWTSTSIAIKENMSMRPPFDSTEDSSRSHMTRTTQTEKSVLAWTSPNRQHSYGNADSDTLDCSTKLPRKTCGPSFSLTVPGLS